MKSSSQYIKTIQSILEYPREQEWFEFKANWFEPNPLGEYVSALANAAAFHGQDFGYLFWGIENDTHAVIGTTFDPTIEVKHEPLKHFLARQLSPDTAFAFHELEMEGKRIVLLEIAAAKTIPTAFANVRYFRIGSSKVVLTKYPERESELFQILRNGPPTLSNTEASRQDLTFDKLIVYYASKGITLNKRTFKKNLGFLMPDGKFNLLAQLLSDDSGITIRFAMFNGKDKTSTMYSVREIGRTCLLFSLDKALELGELLNVPQADERNRIVERKEVPLFNAEACREAIVNAFVHNRWADFNSPMFCAYSDRLEILSHGALPPKQTLQGFFEGVSVPVSTVNSPTSSCNCTSANELAEASPKSSAHTIKESLLLARTLFPSFCLMTAFKLGALPPKSIPKSIPKSMHKSMHKSNVLRHKYSCFAQFLKVCLN